jgi:hypothetical protein
MISRCGTNVSSPSSNNIDRCSSIRPYRNNQYRQTSGTSRSSKCYRPLQQLYKTVYSPTSGNNSSPINFACISRPSDQYKTTNMTYGSFHYNNWAFVQKNRRVNYDTKLSTRCYNNNQKMNNQSKLNERTWNLNHSQPTSDAYCCNTLTLNY